MPQRFFRAPPNENEAVSFDDKPLIRCRCRIFRTGNSAFLQQIRRNCAHGQLFFFG